MTHFKRTQHRDKPSLYTHKPVPTAFARPYWSCPNGVMDAAISISLAYMRHIKDGAHARRFVAGDAVCLSTWSVADCRRHDWISTSSWLSMASISCLPAFIDPGVLGPAIFSTALVIMPNNRGPSKGCRRCRELKVKVILQSNQH